LFAYFVLLTAVCVDWRWRDTTGDAGVSAVTGCIEPKAQSFCADQIFKMSGGPKDQLVNSPWAGHIHGASSHAHASGGVGAHNQKTGDKLSGAYHLLIVGLRGVHLALTQGN